MAMINTTVEDDESKVRLSKQAVKTCHKESGIPMSELVSLIKRMTEEVKEICNYLEKNTEEMRGFFRRDVNNVLKSPDIPVTNQRFYKFVVCVGSIWV